MAAKCGWRARPTREPRCTSPCERSGGNNRMRIRWRWAAAALLTGVWLTACSSFDQSSAPTAASNSEDTNMQPTTDQAALPVMFTAPELQNKVWLNTDHPL